MKNQKGVTMLEMTAVLGVAGILVAGAWKLVTHARDRQRISEATMQVQSLQKNISRFYAAKGNYNELDESGTIKKLLDEKIIPPDLRAGESALKHVFWGDVTLKNVRYANEITNTSTSFSITFSGLSRKVCAELAAISWPEHDMSNMISIQIGENKYVWPSYAESSETGVLPISKVDAIGACSGETNDITWEFR